MSQPPTPRKRVKENDYDPLLKTRFLDRISKMNIATNKDHCWLWAGSRIKFGYGTIAFNHGLYRTHRVAWETFKGIIPKGQYVLHRCHNYSCVNPNHLFLGDQSDNLVYQHKQKKMFIAAGEMAGMAKLTIHQVNRIRRLWKSGKYYQTEIAEMFEISQPQVSRIVNNIYWK